MQDQCRISAGLVQDQCRISAGSVQDQCRISAGLKLPHVYTGYPPKTWFQKSYKKAPGFIFQGFERPSSRNIFLHHVEIALVKNRCLRLFSRSLWQRLRACLAERAYWWEFGHEHLLMSCGIMCGCVYVCVCVCDVCLCVFVYVCVCAICVCVCVCMCAGVQLCAICLCVCCVSLASTRTFLNRHANNQLHHGSC